MTNYFVSSGTPNSGMTITYPDSLYVISGYEALDTTISGGWLYVRPGATAINTIVGSDQYVVSAAPDPGWVEVFGGGTVVNTAVNADGELLLLSGATATGVTVNSGGWEVISGGGTASGTVLHNWGQIDLASLPFVGGGSATIDPLSDVLTVTQGGSSFTEQLSGSYPDAGLLLANDGRAGGGTLVTLEYACYAAGTLLATPDGERAVETLAAGDSVLACQDGTWRPARVRWVGGTRVDLAHHPQPQQAAPVRIARGALAEGVPARDLWLSPDHAILLDGRLIQARALLNGATVTQEFPRAVSYHHVELDRHAVLLAEGLPAESYLDTGNRAIFDGEAGVRPLHLDLAAPAAWDERACAPLLLGGARVAAAHAHVLARAAVLGHAMTEEAGLTVLADGAPLAPTAPGRWRLPAGTRRLTLRSRCFVPAWLGLGEDRRLLGVAVAMLRLGGRPLAQAAFGAGWHAAEDGWRWTDGNAELALPALPRPATLTLRLATTGARYWVAAAPAPRTAVA